MTEIRIHYCATVLSGGDDIWRMHQTDHHVELWGPSGTEYGPDDIVTAVDSFGRAYTCRAMAVARFMGDHADSRDELEMVNRYLAQSPTHPDPVKPAPSRIDNFGCWLPNVRGGLPRVRT